MTLRNITRNIGLIGPIYPIENKEGFIKAVDGHSNKSQLDYVIYIDAGVKLKNTLNFTCSQYSIGDADGCSAQDDKSYKDLVDELYPSEKNESDLKLVLNHLTKYIYSLEQRQDEGLKNNSPSINIHAYGLWGERFDHQMSNIGEFFSFIAHASSKTVLNIYSYNEGDTKLEAIITKGHFKFNYMGTFSIFQLESSSISIEGQVKYPLADHPLGVLSSLGLSNIASGEFSINSTKPFMLILP